MRVVDLKRLDIFSQNPLLRFRKANEIYREHNIERKKRGIEEFSSKSVKLWKDGGYEDRLEKLNLNYEDDLVLGTCVAKEGAVSNERVKSLI